MSGVGMNYSVHDNERKTSECISDPVSIIFSFVQGKRELPLDQLFYVESDLHKLKFYVQEEELHIYTLYDTLNRMEQKLAGNGFLRIHQSYLVNSRYIRGVKRYETELANGTVLNVAQNRYKQVEKYVLAQQKSKA